MRCTTTVADPMAEDETTDAGTGSGLDDDAPPRALPADDIRDAWPEALDASGYAGPSLSPNNNRRRIPAILYWVISALCLVLWFTTKNNSPVLVNVGFVWAAVGLT